MTSRPSAMATGIVDWAARAPERTAVIDVHRTLSVGELDTAAAALAARLLDGAGSREAEQQSWLPIVVDRSVATIVAIHGAIRAGCAFTRIESTMPRDLVAEMLTRLGGPQRAIVADPRFAALLPDGVEVVHPFGHERAGWPRRRRSIRRRLVVCSSPPGRPAVRRVWSSRGHCSTPSCRVHCGSVRAPESTHGPKGSSSSSGPASRPVRSPYRASGAPCALADPTAMSIDDLLDWLDANQVDAVSFAPTLSHAIVRVFDGRPRLPSVSLLRSTSEAANWSLVAPLRRLVGPHLTIRAGYAASEGGLIAHFDIGPDDPIGEGRIPLGRLEAGVEVRLEPLADDPSTTRLVVGAAADVGVPG